MLLLVACAARSECGSSESDPGRLFVTGSLTRSGDVSISKLKEISAGKFDRGKPDGIMTIEVVDVDENVLATLAGGSPRDFDDMSSAPGIQRTDSLDIASAIAYPEGAALVRFRTPKGIVLALEPLSMTLRAAIEAIPARGFAKNADQSRKSLLEMVDVFEKHLAKDTPAARRELDSVRTRVQNWILEFDADAFEQSRTSVLEQIDRVEARLEARVPKFAAAPGILYLDGKITREGAITIDFVREWEQGKADAPLRGGNDPELFSILSLDASGNVLDTHVLRGGWVQEIENQGAVRLTSKGFTQRIAFPNDTALLRFSIDRKTILEMDPLSEMLRTAIEGIPDRGFIRNPGERRTALLAKVGAIEKQIASGARKGAIEKLTSDLRPAVGRWVGEFAERNVVEETTREDALQTIDRVVLRLEHQLNSSTQR